MILCDKSFRRGMGFLRRFQQFRGKSFENTLIESIWDFSFPSFVIVIFSFSRVYSSHLYNFMIVIFTFQNCLIEVSAWLVKRSPFIWSTAPWKCLHSFRWSLTLSWIQQTSIHVRIRVLSRVEWLKGFPSPTEASTFFGGKDKKKYVELVSMYCRMQTEHEIGNICLSECSCSSIFVVKLFFPHPVISSSLCFVVCSFCFFTRSFIHSLSRGNKSPFHKQLD